VTLPSSTTHSLDYGLLIYRLGSRIADASFFLELSDLLDRLTTLTDPIMIASDLNIRLDRPDDPLSRCLLELLATYMSCRVSTPTRDRGGLLDVVLTQEDKPLPSALDVIDPGPSDHRLMRWSCCLQRPPPVYVSATYRPRRRLDVDAFRHQLQQSALCSTEYVGEDVDAMADLCNSELTAIVDRLLPLRTTSCRTRPSDPGLTATAATPNDAVDASNAVRAGRRTIGSRGNPNYAPIAVSFAGSEKDSGRR